MVNVCVKDSPLPAKLPRVVVYLPPELKADLEKLAEARRRPVSNLLLVLVEQEVKEAKENKEI